ncbi:GroES-like protein [Erysiphe pulchra]|uniref:GroES-like protein n=1 Tax=Erysiphe pulchra TaxID=225359 RepID=A0A2S4PS01_9PEZI|nr:GroES-like protein [Erysiphe pulchra]
MTTTAPTSYDEVVSSVLHGAKDLRTENRRLSAPESFEVQVAIKATGLCGSDLHYFNHYRNGDIIVQEPLTLGHESAGVIVATGSAVTNLKVGDKVALEVGLPCSKCDLCYSGRYNLCKVLKFRSSAKSFPHYQGTLQERINHSAAFCHKLPENVSLEMGAILEPLSVAIHGLRRAALKDKATVLIFGAGAVGLLCAAMCRVNGAKTVIIADIQDNRLEFSIQHGFSDIKILIPMKRPQTTEEKLAFAREVSDLIKKDSGIDEVDATFECTGVESCTQAAIYSTRPGGCIMIIGMGTPILTLPMSAAALREIDIRGVFRYAYTYEEAIQLISSKNPLLPDLSSLITHRFKGFDNIPLAFDMAGRVKDDSNNLVLKVMIATN